MLRGPDYAGAVSVPVDNEYPGQRLGLPRDGRGSIARPGRRIAALLIDVASAGLIGFAFFSSPDPVTGVPFANPLATNLIFFVVQILFIPLIGGSPGHRLMGMRLELASGGWVGLWRPIVRTVLLALVIPAVVWDADQRGLHDKAVGTLLVRS
ncbi:RDD family protein [Microbacterium trichothecenolyticum]|uniref:RDD family membrane protein YckC n=1 Tax=Microbacterium trichothecenolyticum TaxID=69370 RepID=A0ABU0TRT8_MICTR|nr:RDD family protein [Microbacterium trichothecenolyticum]MDQ1122175.1 putative RDD family membrane protein YckC [Microbacterium trichothecenolyticum]